MDVGLDLEYQDKQRELTILLHLPDRFQTIHFAYLG